MNFFIHPTCNIHPTVKIDVKDGFIGPYSVINEFAVIQGNHVEIGRESFIDRFATIGGGSCFDKSAFLKTGDWFHMGVNSQVNIARGVTIGHEVGVGIDSKIFTHGAYIDSYNLGAPAQWDSVVIGDSVWLPNAWINPGVTIGSNVVVGARSLVTTNIPSGSLAAGSPAKILKQNFYPRNLSISERRNIGFLLLKQIKERVNSKECMIIFDEKNHNISINHLGSETVFDIKNKLIFGNEFIISELVKDQLRRNGIRFRYEILDNKWMQWV
jgi:acetyltransferase-like isoleucine patch superfamily enzyme